MQEPTRDGNASDEEVRTGVRRRRWRDWDSIDRLGVVVSIATALLIIGLVVLSAFNGDPAPHP